MSEKAPVTPNHAFNEEVFNGLPDFDVVAEAAQAAADGERTFNEHVASGEYAYQNTLNRNANQTLEDRTQAKFDAEPAFEDLPLGEQNLELHWAMRQDDRTKMHYMSDAMFDKFLADNRPSVLRNYLNNPNAADDVKDVAIRKLGEYDTENRIAQAERLATERKYYTEEASYSELAQEFADRMYLGESCDNLMFAYEDRLAAIENPAGRPLTAHQQKLNHEKADNVRKRMESLVDSKLRAHGVNRQKAEVAAKKEDYRKDLKAFNDVRDNDPRFSEKQYAMLHDGLIKEAGLPKEIFVKLHAGHFYDPEHPDFIDLAKDMPSELRSWLDKRAAEQKSNETPADVAARVQARNQAHGNNDGNTSSFTAIPKQSRRERRQEAKDNRLAAKVAKAQAKLDKSRDEKLSGVKYVAKRLVNPANAKFDGRKADGTPLYSPAEYRRWQVNRRRAVAGALLAAAALKIAGLPPVAAANAYNTQNTPAEIAEQDARK